MDAIDLQNVLISVLTTFVVPIAVTIPVTAFFCRRRIARKKRVSHGTVLLAAVTTPVLFAVVLTLLNPYSWSIRGKGTGLYNMIGSFAFVAAICILPAMVVVNSYKRRSNRDDKRLP
jgi:uncharacterized membrane protein YozB (DUF420 family)